MQQTSLAKAKAVEIRINLPAPMTDGKPRFCKSAMNCADAAVSSSVLMAELTEAMASSPAASILNDTFTADDDCWSRLLFVAAAGAAGTSSSTPVMVMSLSGTFPLNIDVERTVTNDARSDSPKSAAAYPVRVTAALTDASRGGGGGGKGGGEGGGGGDGGGGGNGGGGQDLDSDSTLDTSGLAPSALT